MKKIDKASISKQMSVSNLKRFSKIFIVNHHSPALEAFEVKLAKLVELGSCRKIVAVKPKPNVPAATSFDDTRMVRQIVEGLEKSKKQIEGIWRTLKRDLDSDIWKQWNDTMHHAKILKEQKSKEAKEKFKEGKGKKDYNKGDHISHGSQRGSAEQSERTQRKSQVSEVTTINSGEVTDGEHPTDEEEDEYENLRRPPAIPRLIEIADMQVLYDELHNQDMNIADYYTVIFCKTPSVMVKDLLQLGIVISAIIHFFPCPVSEIDIHYPDIYSDIQEFRKCDETKQIGLFVNSLNVDLLADYNPILIYEQFKSYLFDIEMLSQHFIIYQKDFMEINDATSKENMVRHVRVDSSKETSDITAVCVYFDKLCRMVENATKYDRRYSSFHPRPFIDNDYGKIIVEDSNELLKSALSAEMNLVTYWRAVDMIINAIRRNHSTSALSLDKIKLPAHNELLSWESFAQRLETKKLEYDHCTRIDITEKCKVFRVRRTLNKIIETSSKMHLPTKLCFRDFCHFIAPQYIDVLRHHFDSLNSLLSDKEGTDADEDELDSDPIEVPMFDYDNKRAALFSGLSFDDTYQELTIGEKCYRFHPTGYIHVRLGNWMYKERKLTVEIGLFKCTMYTHLWDEYPLPMIPKVRIISKNDVSVNVEFFENEPQPSISVQWPNDCQIRYINEDGIFAVEQRYYWDTGPEYKRIYIPNGCVLVYLRNDIINVLTPNGVYYNLFPIGYTDPDEPDDRHKFYRPLNSIDISSELEFVKSLTGYGIDCEYFDVTKTDGSKIRVLHGVPIEEKAKYLMYQWMDLGYSELFGERDDGIKLIWSFEGLKTYYPCGTMIHTVTTDDFIEVSFDCRSASTEHILQKINPDIIRRLDERRIDRQIFLSYELTYHVKHERYASITCYDDKRMIIQSPDHVRVSLSGDPNDNIFVIDFGDKASFRFMTDVCYITSSYDKDMLIKLNLIPNDEEIVRYESYNVKVVLKENGQFMNESDNAPLDPIEEELYFLVKPYKFGIAFLPDHEVKAIVEANKRNDNFYQTPNKIVLFKKILPINERFSMPMPEKEPNLNKLFITNCRKGPKEAKYSDIVYSARIIIKAKTPKNVCDYMKEISYIEYTLSDYLQDALDYWYLKKPPKSKYSPAWKKKIKETAKQVHLNKIRAPVYNAMVKYKVFPKYHEYIEVGKNLDKLNVNDLMPKLLKKGFSGSS